jgi:sec-independent protein translocase protein TatA
MLGMRGPELLIILLVLLLLFGATRLPQLGSSLGSAIRNFKKGFGGDDDEGEGERQKKGHLTATSETDLKDGTTAKVGAKES